VVQWLYVKPEQTDLDKVIESLIYSFIVYLTFLAFFGRTLPVRLLTEQNGGTTRYDVQLQPKPLGELAAIAIVLALVIGGVITNDLTGTLFRKLRLTQRTTRSSVWSDAFHDRGGIVQVELGDGRRVMGWLRYYSDEPKDSSVFLEKAVWVVEDLKTIPIEGPGILITRELGINWVEFLDRPDSPGQTGAGSVNSAQEEKPTAKDP
jgi:hypothetical protein